MLNTKKMVISGMLLAVALFLPFLTGQIPEIGSSLSPLHIPVLLCGFICGWPYGLIIGIIAPLLRSVLFTMPPMFPQAVVMSFELAAYGFFTGILYKLLPKKNVSIYISLIVSMFLGRIVWGLISFTAARLFDLNFGMSIFLASGFIKAVPGIILHILMIPPIVLSLERAGYMK